MATIAVFLALGGGAYAISLKRNSVGPKQLKTDAVTGIDAKESTFDQVPSAVSAVSASNADTASNAALLDNLDSVDFLRANGPAGGALTGNFPNPTLANGAVTPSKLGTIPAARAAEPCDDATPGYDVQSGVDERPRWNTEQFDTAGLHSVGCGNPESSKLVAPIAGAYQVSAGFFWGNNDTGTRFLGLLRNGSPIAGDRRGIVPGGLSEEQSVSTLVMLNAGDAIEAVVFQDAGVTVPGGTAGQRDFLAMHWVGPG